MDDIQALLFCGGRGTRLFPVTDYYQKVMMPIGDEGRPILEYVIRSLSSQGITDFIALIRYRANQIRRYFGTGEKFGVNITYVLDNPELKGTGGALLNAIDCIDAKTMLIYFTDILSSLNIQKMYEFHDDHKKIGTAWIDPSWSVSEGLIKVDRENIVKQIDKKPDATIFANTGISLLDDSVFDIIEHFYEKQGSEIDLSGDIFPYLAEKNEIMAYLSDDWWIDIGSLSRHKRMENDVLMEQLRRAT